MAKKRLLVVCQHFWPENFRLNDICDGFIEHDIDVDVLCGEPNYPKGEWFEGYGMFKRRVEEHNGVKIYRCPEIRRKNNTSIRIFLNYISFPVTSSFTVRKLYKNKYDKVFIYSLSPVYMGRAGLKIAKKQKIESVTYVLDLWPENLYSVIPFKNKLIRKILYNTSTKYYKRTDKLICLSEKAKEILMERTGKSEDKFLVMPQCCEKFYETPIRDEALVSRFSGSFNVVFAGNISPAQDFPVMIEAARLLRERGVDVRFIIVGDGMSRADVEREVAEKGLSDCFFFEGSHPAEDVPRYTYIADALIACLTKSPLLDCTIPAKVMSYIAAGKPIVLAMDGEANRTVNEYGCGFATESGNASLLADSIERLAKMSKEEREAIADRVRALHFEKFERDSNLERFINFIFE